MADNQDTHEKVECHSRYSSLRTTNSLTTYGTYKTPHSGSVGNQQARENPPKQISVRT
jgi:hypothetical protein